MRFTIPVILILFFSNITKGQAGINILLKKELDSIFIEDQQYRDMLSIVFTPQGKDSLATVFKVPVADIQLFIIRKLQDSDSLNMVRIAEIIEQYGYPGKKLVGSPSNEAAFFVIQHSTKIDQYLPLIRKAAKQDEIAFQLYGMMLDRSLMNRGKEQVYGTQGKGFETTDPVTGKKEWKTLIWPIKKPATVNKRRKKAGFPVTAEENAKRLGIKYEILTLKEVKKLQGS